MHPITVTVAAQPTHVRLLTMGPQGEMMRAILGPISNMHPRAAITLLEGLALWHQQQLSVVVAVDGQDDGSAMGLFDALGLGERTLHFEVGVAVAGARRPRRLHGLGSFRDLRQLSLLERDAS
jgi:hypothetical protein